MVVDKPNVASIVFKEHEGSYLVGILAAMASKTGKVGFVGGMDIPLIRKFACGYVGGVKSVKPDAEIFQNMTGTTGAAWNDPVKGGELAKSQFERGADVVYHAAGGTGLGVLQAAADAGKLGIGVDSNQNYIHPGHVLTSMLKRVDVATYKTFEAAKNDNFKPGVQVLGLAEGGVGWALDENNKPLITEEMKTAVAKAEEDIKSGAVKVHDVGKGVCAAQGNFGIAQRPMGSAQGQPRKIGEGDDTHPASQRQRRAHAAGKDGISLFLAAAQHRGDTGAGKTDGQGKMPKSMIRLAAETADEEHGGGPAGDRGIRSEFAIGLVLGSGKSLAWNITVAGSERFRRRIEITYP